MFVLLFVSYCFFCTIIYYRISHFSADQATLNLQVVLVEVKVTNPTYSSSDSEFC